MMLPPLIKTDVSLPHKMIFAATHIHIRYAAIVYGYATPLRFTYAEIRALQLRTLFRYGDAQITYIHID